MAAKSDAADVYEIAVRLLARREHSRYELREKLSRRGIHDDVIQAVIEKLSSNGYLSDVRYVEMYIRRQLRKGDGPLKIRAYLQSHGIEKALITEHLPNDDEFWIQNARESDKKCCVRNKFSQETALDGRAKAVRARYLQNRGYPSHVIARVLDSYG